MFISDLSYYLESQGIGTRGTSLFIEDMPDVSGLSILLSLSSDLPEREYGVYKYRVQALVKATTYEEAHNKSVDIFNALHGKDDRLVLKANGADVMTCFAIQTPEPLGRDEKERYVFSTNYEFTLRGSL